MMWLLAGVFIAPILHLVVRRTKFWGVRTVVAGLVFAPGLCLTAWLVWFVITINDWVVRWTLTYYLQGRGGLRCLAVLSGITAIYLGVCLLLEHFSKLTDCDGENGPIRVVEVWRSLAAIQLVLTGGAAYLYSYHTLGDAVTSNNLALAEKRLTYNLEGLGPNDGLIVSAGSAGLDRYPLLPVAVKNGNYGMVTLLVNHGADLNPKNWDDKLGLPSGLYVKNPLYFAVENHDFKMIDLLIDLGANPEHGIGPALSERDAELLKLLLKKGVSLDFALGVAEQRGYNQEFTDKLFAGQIPEAGVKEGQ